MATQLWSGVKKFGASWPVALVALVLILAAAPAFAQVIPTGTISGVVKDPAGQSVPNANVTIIEVQSNYTRTATTNDQGGYRVPALPIGRYDVKVEMTGFKSETQPGLTLDVAQEQVVNFTMEVGSTQQEVVVTAEAPRVDTTTSALGHLVDNTQIADLPLNGRNFVDLTLMQTGVTHFAYNNFGTNGLFGEFYSSNGAPIRSNMYTIDGAIMGNVQGASASSVSGLSLGVDGIQEYKVMTNTFSAEYGLTMGSQMTIVSKGGSNQFHGDAFEYMRNSVLDARNFFDLLNTLPSTVPGGGRRNAPFKRNQFGGSVGGPIKKDKTFFFATFEGFDETYDNPPNVGVTPTIPAACHTNLTPGTANFTVGNVCDPSAAGPTEVVSPNMVPILNLWPSPNLPNSQFTYLSSEINHEYFGQGRIDHNFSNSDRLFGRYSADDTNEVYPKLFPLFDDGLIERQQYVTLAENHTFSPALLNSGRFSYSRSHVLSSTPSSSNPNTAALTGPQFSCVAGLPICPINISSIANFSGASALAIVYTQNILTVGDDLFWTKGKHGVKFGVLINHYDQNVNNNQGPKGSISIPDLHSFLTGVYRNYTIFTPGSNGDKDMLFDTLGFYVQDDYRVLPHLTLNLGLRYEFNTQPNEKNGNQSFFVNPPYSNAPTVGPIVNNPTHRDVSPRVGFAWDIFGDGKTALRGGFAVLYDVANLGSVFGISGASMPPYSISYVVTPKSGGPATLQFPLPVPSTALSGSLQGTSPTTITQNYKSPHMLDFNLGIERQLPGNMVLSMAYAGSRGLNLWQPANEANPFCPTSFTAVIPGCAATTTVVPGALPVWASATAPRLNPFFANFALFGTAGVSWYNALEVNLTKKMGHGLEFQSAYTYSRLLDDTEGTSNSDTSGSNTGLIEDPLNPLLEYGPANFNVTHNWRFNVLYHFPTFAAHGFVDKLVNGWWTGSIVSVQTGFPFSPLLSSDREQSGLAGTNGGLERPSFVTSANLAAVTVAAAAAGAPTPVVYNPNTVITGNVNQWFNPNMFTLQPVGTIGNVGRNILTDPGLGTWDFSINKDTSLRFLGEAGKLQFRAEMFNILNRANFGPAQNGGFLSGSVKDPVITTGGIPASAEVPAFTGIINTATAGRQIQFSLKILF